MGYAKPDLQQGKDSIRRQLAAIHDNRSDGFIQSHCKYELYLLKCWLEDEYDQLPKFAGEEKWEQDRVIQLLKKE
jgi:hypothetical protein